MQKECPCCHETKSAAEFYMNNARRDGLTLYCRECIKTNYSVKKPRIEVLMLDIEDGVLRLPYQTDGVDIVKTCCDCHKEYPRKDFSGKNSKSSVCPCCANLRTAERNAKMDERFSPRQYCRELLWEYYYIRYLLSKCTGVMWYVLPIDGSKVLNEGNMQLIPQLKYLRERARLQPPKKLMVMVSEPDGMDCGYLVNFNGS